MFEALKIKTKLQYEESLRNKKLEEMNSEEVRARLILQ